MPGLTAKWAQTMQVGLLTPAQGSDLYAKTVQACDALDGIQDGIVGNPLACPFDRIAHAQRCTGQPDGTCLTEADLAKVNALTTDLTLQGTVIGPAWGATANLSTLGSSAVLGGGFLGLAFRSATPVDTTTFDIPSQFLEVKTVLDDVYSMTGDLDGIRKYLARDKKLILFQGWEDNVVPAYGSINFYRALRKADPQGARNVRLYMGPNVQHCGGGTGADSTDLLMVMAKWVEQNAEPGAPANPAYAWKRASPTGPQDISGALFARPLCPYPQFPFYRGQGNPDHPSSYVCRPGPER
jgi:feruloyl esterase